MSHLGSPASARSFSPKSEQWNARPTPGPTIRPTQLGRNLQAVTLPLGGTPRGQPHRSCEQLRAGGPESHTQLWGPARSVPHAPLLYLADLSKRWGHGATSGRASHGVRGQPACRPHPSRWLWGVALSTPEPPKSAQPRLPRGSPQGQTAPQCTVAATGGSHGPRGSQWREVPTVSAGRQASSDGLQVRGSPPLPASATVRGTRLSDGRSLQSERRASG